MAVLVKNKRTKRKKKGAPALFKTAKELQDKIDQYFNDTGEATQDPDLPLTNHRKIFTITGLAYFLGFESRQSFYDYGEREAFSYTIKRARLRLEMVYEERLADQKPVGAIFALKNLGWVDKVENTHSLKLIEPITGIKIIRDGTGI